METSREARIMGPRKPRALSNQALQRMIALPRCARAGVLPTTGGQTDEFRYCVDVRQPAPFLRRVMREFTGNARLSLEGTFDETAFPAEAIAGHEPTPTLKRSTLEPTLNFLILNLEPQFVDRVFSQISRIGLRENIVHVQVEKDGRIELGAYDNFHSECVVTGPAISEALLAELQAAGVIRRFSPANR